MRGEENDAPLLQNFLVVVKFLIIYIQENATKTWSVKNMQITYLGSGSGSGSGSGFDLGIDNLE